MQEGRSAWVPKGTAFIFGREKEKGKKGRMGLWELKEDHMHDLYSTVAWSQPTHKARSEQTLFASYAGGIMGIPIKGNPRIYLPNQDAHPAHCLLSPIHERNREQAGDG